MPINITSRNIRLGETAQPATESQQIEIVERKGIGHPDSLCDGIAERVSQALATEYRERLGTVLHFNTDEAQLIAGQSTPRFGGGDVTKPIHVLVAGRATREYNGTTIPVHDIALDAARSYLDETLPALDAETDVTLDIEFGAGSGDLQRVVTSDSNHVTSANDTSYGVGYAPLSPLEQLVYSVERDLQTQFRPDHPALGQDVKVMGVRDGEHVTLTVAAALIDTHVADREAYDAEIASIREFIADRARRTTPYDVDIAVNTADSPGTDEDDVYLTVTGTSAEMGDDGSVGRGNRANGLITPNRTMSMEASSGKNPVAHIGKLYNLLAQELARDIVEGVSGVESANVRLVSQIGRPVTDPLVADIQVGLAPGRTIADVEESATSVVESGLDELPSLSDRVIAGKLTTF